MRILITAGPTREYLDDVRYLSNASSGRMGYSLAQAALDLGHRVSLVTGPVSLSPPAGCEVTWVETTEELLEACQRLFPMCDGVIATAAVCDYRPAQRFSGKMAKSGVALRLELVETADVLANLGRQKGSQWMMGFALESDEFAHQHALKKLKEKNCDVIVLNRPTAIGSVDNAVEVIDPSGTTAARFQGSKILVAQKIMLWIEEHLSRRSS